MDKKLDGLTDLQRRLQVMAEQVGRLHAQLTCAALLPPDDLKLGEALASLREALPRTYFTVDLVVQSWPDDEPKPYYRVWDGAKHYDSPTLRGVVAACLEAKAEPPANGVAIAQGVIDQATVTKEPPF